MNKEDVVSMCIIYTYNGILLSHNKKKNEKMPFEAMQMNLKITILSEESQRNAIWYHLYMESKFSSAAQSCPTLCDHMDCSTPGFPVHHQLPELAQTHVHQVGDAIQLSYPLSSPSPPAFNHSHHQNLFQWVSSSHQVAEVLEFQLQHQSFQWIFRTGFL